MHKYTNAKEIGPAGGNVGIEEQGMRTKPGCIHLLLMPNGWPAQTEGMAEMNYVHMMTMQYIKHTQMQKIQTLPEALRTQGIEFVTFN